MNRQILLLVFMTWLAMNASASAHPAHISIGEVEWNADSSVLEVAVKVQAVDLERVLAQRTGRRVNLDSDAKVVDEAVLRYLKQALRFQVDNGKRPRPLNWVGKEVTLKDVWLYLEVPIPPATKQLSVENTLFFELQKDQVNSLNFRLPDRRQTLSTTWERPTQTLTFQDDKPKAER